MNANRETATDCGRLRGDRPPELDGRGPRPALRKPTRQPLSVSLMAFVRMSVRSGPSHSPCSTITPISRVQGFYREKTPIVESVRLVETDLERPQ